MSDNKSNYRVLRKEACPRCRSKNQDNSGDNLVVYADSDNNESSHCFSCGYTKASKEFKKESYEDRYEYSIEMSGEFTVDMWARLKETTGVDPRGYRGLTKETCSYYGIRHNFDEMGQVTHQYYPVTKNSELVGIKWRDTNKKFTNRGEANADCDLFGQVAFRTTTSKTVVIASGEIDCLSLFQVLRNYTESKGWEPVPVVSSIIGEGGLKQYQNQYEWLNKFDKIIICPDNDAPGQEYLHKIIKVLPRNKLFVMDLPLKDVNECMVKGKEKNIVSEFFKARAYTPSGIIGSDQLHEALLSGLKQIKVSLPSHLLKLQIMLRGGFKIPSMVNIVAPTGVGKCLAKGTVLRKADFSTIKVEDVQVGDRLLRPDGLFNVVTNLGNGVDTMYKVSQTFGIDYVVNSAHILSLKVHTYDNKTFKDLDQGTVVNIPILDYIKLDKSDQKRLKGWRSDLPLLPVYNPLNITKEVAYILGYWLGDGFSGDARIVIHNSETEVFERLMSFCNKEDNPFKYSCKMYPSNIKKQLSVVTILGLFKHLDFFRLRGNKHIPNYFLNCSTELKLNLLAGLIDSDGYRRNSSVSKNIYEITWKLEHLAKTCRDLILSLGGRCTLTKVFKSAHENHVGAYYRLQISSIPFEIPCAVPRKKNCIETLNHSSTLLSSISVEEIGQGEYYGFTLTGDKLFCLEDLTVTHNTTYTNELIYYWIFNSPYKIGILSLELDRHEYSNVLASRHLNIKLNLLEECEAEALISLPENTEKCMKLWLNEDKSPRFYLMEERDGKLENIKKLIEQLIISCDCKIIVLDPIQDLFAGLSISDQEEFSAWIKITMKAYGVCFICINHIRKPNNGPVESNYSETEVKGSSTLIQSSSYNILLYREKDPDPVLSENQQAVLKNTITQRLTKNRNTGITGDAGSLFYDSQAHTLYDLEEYKESNPELFAEEVSDY